MNACVQNSPTTCFRKIVHPVALWRLQPLAHTNGVDGPDLIKMLLQRLYHGVESQGVGYHQQPIRTAGRFDDFNRLTRCAGHGLFDYDGLARPETFSKDAFMMA